MIELSENWGKERERWHAERTKAETEFLGPPLILAAYSNQGFSKYGTALHCLIGDHGRE